MIGSALIVMVLQAPVVAPTPGPTAQPTPPAQPYVQPYAQPYAQPYVQPTQQPYAQPYAQPYVQPYAQPYAQPYGPQGVAPYSPYPPPMSADERREWLEQRHGSRYPGRKGGGMLVGGGLTLGFGAMLGLSTLACMFTTAALQDSGETEDVGTLRSITIGLGIATVASLGAGIPLVIVGKQRRRAYRAWLEQQPMARLSLGGGGLTLRF
jgi:hypothetical protein